MSTPPTIRPALRWATCFTPTMEPATLPELARAAEAAGYDELWVWEDCFAHSAVASAAVALSATTHLTVGIGLMPAPLRAVTLTAMELTTLARIFPGRLIAGLGHGVQEWMGQAGVRVASPLTLLREQVEVLRELLAGRPVTTAGRYVTLDDVRLTWPPVAAPPLMIGGTGPRTVDLAAELSDGLLLPGARTSAEVRGYADRVRTRQPDLPVVAS